MKDIADLIGRILIAFIFIYEAFDSVLFFENTVTTMREYGLTWYPNVFLTLAIFALLLGGALVLIGYYASFGAFLLLLYYLPMTCIVYSFWNDPAEFQRINSLHFMRNLALCGGLLILIANGAGRYSVKRLIYVMRLPK
jgi:putative oxidoreductase